MPESPRREPVRRNVDRAIRLELLEPVFEPNQWLTIEEAAALLKVSPRRMRRWVYNGAVGSKVLPGGRGRRISGAHLNAAMTDHEEH